MPDHQAVGYSMSIWLDRSVEPTLNIEESLVTMDQLSRLRQLPEYATVRIATNTDTSR